VTLEKISSGNSTKCIGNLAAIFLRSFVKVPSWGRPCVRRHLAGSRMPPLVAPLQSDNREVLIYIHLHIHGERMRKWESTWKHSTKDQTDSSIEVVWEQCTRCPARLAMRTERCQGRKLSNTNYPWRYVEFKKEMHLEIRAIWTHARTLKHGWALGLVLITYGSGGLCRHWLLSEVYIDIIYTYVVSEVHGMVGWSNNFTFKCEP
jgi:hypothetical protein